MNKADGQDTASRLSAIVANSLDTPAKTQDLARQAYRSRTQFHRLFRTVVEETPAAMRRRLLLERAAYQLGHTGMSVTDVALDANYGSLEAFTRAFRKAFRSSPSVYRRMRDPHFHLPASNQIHFFVRQKGRRKPERLRSPCPKLLPSRLLLPQNLRQNPRSNRQRSLHQSPKPKRNPPRKARSGRESEILTSATCQASNRRLNIGFSGYVAASTYAVATAIAPSNSPRDFRWIFWISFNADPEAFGSGRRSVPPASGHAEKRSDHRHPGADAVDRAEGPFSFGFVFRGTAELRSCWFELGSGHAP